METPTLRKKMFVPTGEIAYSKRMACQLHFTKSNYDYFDYKQKIRNSKKAFDNLSQRQQLQYCRIESKYYKKMGENIDIFFATAFIQNKSKMPQIHELINDTFHVAYSNNIAWLMSAEYKFLQEMKSILPEKTRENFNKLFSNKKSDLPKIYKLLLQDKININTVTILEKIFGFSNNLNNIETNPLGEQIRQDILNYGRFINLDREKYLLILKEKL